MCVCVLLMMRPCCFIFVWVCMCTLVRLSAGQRACPVAHHRVPAVRCAPVHSCSPAREVRPRQERREANKFGCQDCVDLSGREVRCFFFLLALVS